MCPQGAPGDNEEATVTHDAERTAFAVRRNAKAFRSGRGR